MTREVIRREDPDLGHLAGGVIATGEDRVVVSKVYDNAAEAPMEVKSLRLPKGLHDEAMAVGHTLGFSGVVRDALEQYLHPENQADDVRHALEVLRVALSQQKAA